MTQHWLDEFLASEEFYNAMQNYRHVPITDQHGTVLAFEAVKEWIRQGVGHASTDKPVTDGEGDA
jgi:hypothetical protein